MADTPGHALLLKRRQFLVAGIGAGLTALAAGGTQANPLSKRTGLALPTHYADAAQAEAFWAQPRVVNLTRAATGEHRRVCFWRDGAVVPGGYREVCHVLRDVRGQQATAMDLRLLNMLFGMQSWLYAVHGFDEPYLVTSGYRSEHTNANTEGAAKNSLHVKGMAVDGRYANLPAEFVGKFLASYRAGGVGFYLDRRNFIHTDVGKVRFWSTK
ncbi:YcbK family protein [Pseudoxanthomonas kaohsiungensis]|uniref:Murein endopeptidase K n=1 Tax=Pseudoxanthomonas kaohsiungensis TaxID=283923 RepID=A0ABW3LXF9_9GAMM|nr:DUF882 domain-containing protein [Pseudoxanthomonas kaohsiungensis]KAF1702927.1 hypothetical protein CSC66_09130 [Pseudoxanthomonas kaohsiungensis]